MVVWLSSRQSAMLFAETGNCREAGEWGAGSAPEFCYGTRRINQQT